MSKPQLPEKARALIEKERMLCAGDRVLVAVSGGADSLALLHALWRMRESLGLREVAAAHVHHGLRGAEADRDEEAVRTFCAAHEVRLFVCHADVAAEARRRGDGIEEAGRAVRYAFLEQTAAEHGFDRIATAHTLTDAMETVLLHMVRGTGLKGLCGIPPVRGRVIRPLLTCTRADVETYDAAAHIVFVTDSSNGDLTFSRNRVRRQILPVLYQLNPRAEEAFARLMGTVGEDEAYLHAQALADLAKARIVRGVYRRTVLQALPPAIRSRVLRAAVEETAAVCPEASHVQAMDALLANGGRVTIAGAVEVAVEHATVAVWPLSVPAAEEQPLVVGQSYRFGLWMWQGEVLERADWEKRKKIHKNLLQFTYDCDKIGSVPVVRGRRTGDVLHPVHGNGSKTVKKWMNERHVPSPLRDALPVLADAQGVFLVPGLGCDRRVAVSDDTRRVLVFTIQEMKE